MFKFNSVINLRLLVLSFILIFSAATSAQRSDNGSLSGIVSDVNGAVVPNATVKALSVDTGLERIAQTNGQGRWTITGLKLGNYKVTAEAATFATTEQQDATVTASETTEITLILGVTAGQVQVEVNAGDSTSSISEELSPVTGSTITGRRVEALPAPNRSVFNFLGNDPSVSVDLTDPQTNGTGNGEPAINGNRTTSIGVQFNGIDATNFSGTGSLTGNISPAPETVQEVKVQTSLYDASLGRNGGGSIQIVTRNGTNKFAGTAYIYAQNEKFNANDFFFNRDNIDRQRARRLEGGFTLGGPIIKNKLFFFGGYQKTDAVTAYVPTAQSLVILPEALAFAPDRTVAGLLQGFRAVTALRQGQGINVQGCQIVTPGGQTQIPNVTACLNPFGAGFQLFTLRNPITGDFLLPTLREGRFERLFFDLNNSDVTSASLNGNPLTLPQLRALFPNGFPLTDPTEEQGPRGGNPLVRFRNVFPADFKQDQFTTRLDYNLLKGNSEGKNVNTLYGTFFFANFPASEPFTDDTLVSPFPVIKNDRNRTLAVTDQHVFNGNFINEARFGYFSLNNSRSLDERLLQPEYTNAGFGIINPASFFVPGEESQRCGRVSGRGNIQDFTACAPNDAYNQRKQITFTFADNITYTRGSHNARFGVEHKRNFFDTNLPEEQGGDFEGFRNFGQILQGLAPESDTAFGISDKQFRFNDLSFYASDDWKVSSRLTLNLGLRWDWFGRPFEKNGRFANFDPSLLTNPDDPRPGFILPNNVTATGFNAIDASLPTINQVNNNHTLNGQDLNNFAPRVGFAWSPFKNGKTTFRGGYGIFYDRPSASFINTVYSNYPFFREIEVGGDSLRAVDYRNAFRGQNPTTPFSQYLPYRVVYLAAPEVNLIDNTIRNPIATSNSEPLEFRAVDRNLKTPLIQQWNLGVQQEFGDGWVVEARYVGTKGQQLLLAIGFNQPYDLNDPATPDYIFERLNQAYNLALPRGGLRAGATARERGCGIAFGGFFQPGAFNPLPGFPYPSGPACTGFGSDFDYNLVSAESEGRAATALIDAEVRVPYLGFDQNAVMLQSRGYSNYHSGQLNVSKRFSRGLSFNASYTISNSIDIGSTDPGSTTASGRPDTPSLGLISQGDQRNLNSNRARSDFDRRHRFSSSFVWELPTFGSQSKLLKGWQLSGFGQWQSGTPFSIIATDTRFRDISNELFFAQQFSGVSGLNQFFPTPQGRVVVNRNAYNPGRASGTIYDTQFARPNIRSLELLRQRNCPEITRCYFNTNFNPNDPDTAILAAYGRFGNLGRNVLVGPSQKRIDLSLQKTTKITERVSLELKWDVFNLFNFVNFANPNADITDETDFGQITRTVGAPRVMQFGAKMRF